MKLSEVFDNKIIICIQVILYKVLLNSFYVNKIMFVYDYFTICPSNNTLYTFVFSWLILFLTLPLLIKLFRRKTLSSQIIILLYFISFVPSNVLLTYSSDYIEFNILISIYWLLLLWLGSSNLSIKCKVAHARTNFMLYVIIAIVGGTVFYVSYKFTGLRLHLSLDNVYDIRFESREYSIPTIMQYIMASSGTILSLGLLYFLSERKYAYAMVVIFLFVINFGIGGHKSVIFKLLIALLGYFFYTKERVRYFPLFFILLTFACISIPIISILFGFRVMMLPASIHYSYYEFFNVNQLDYMREGILSRFGFNSPYSDGIMYLIGEKMTGNIEIAANNGLFSDAYMNFGYIGILIYPFFLVTFLKIADKFAEGISFKLLFGVIYTFALCLTSATFTTSLLTGGLLLSLIFLSFIPTKK